jgi:hypothetical protein
VKASQSKVRRRDVIVAAAAVVAAPALAQQAHQHSELVQIAGAYKPQVFTEAQMAWVGKLADTIIPRTDTPGASDAGVPRFIDRILKRDDSLRTRFMAGMVELDAAARKQFSAGFGDLTSAQQIEVLTPASKDRASSLGQFFRLAKDLTIDGYYTSKDGLTKELQWNANTFLPEFKGCTHPEHQG